MKRKRFESGAAEVTMLTAALASPETGLTDCIDIEYEVATEAGDPCHLASETSAKSTAVERQVSLTLADAILALVAVASVFDIAGHRAGTAAWLAIFGAALRAKFVLVEHLPPSWPEWIAFAAPSAIMWLALYLAL